MSGCVCVCVCVCFVCVVSGIAFYVEWGGMNQWCGESMVSDSIVNSNAAGKIGGAETISATACRALCTKV